MLPITRVVTTPNSTLMFWRMIFCGQMFFLYNRRQQQTFLVTYEKHTLSEEIDKPRYSNKTKAVHVKVSKKNRNQSRALSNYSLVHVPLVNYTCVSKKVRSEKKRKNVVLRFIFSDQLKLVNEHFKFCV